MDSNELLMASASSAYRVLLCVWFIRYKATQWLYISLGFYPHANGHLDISGNTDNGHLCSVKDVY